MSKGGKLLGTGSYGCVFKPSLKCRNKRKVKNKNSLSNGILFPTFDLTDVEGVLTCSTVNLSSFEIKIF